MNIPSVFATPTPQMMEINSHKRSGPLWQAEPPARGSSAPFERQTKAKDFCPLCLLLKIPLKICSCLLQSAPQFFYWCSVFFLSFFFGSRGGGEGGGRQGDVLAWSSAQDGNDIGPLDKTFPLFSLLLPLSFAGIGNAKKNFKNW